MDFNLNHSRNREMEMEQDRSQEMSYGQRVEQLYNDIDGRVRENGDVAKVFDRYSDNDQQRLKDRLAHAAAVCTKSPDPHITRMFISNDGKHIAGWVNEHFMFKVPYPEHDPDFYRRPVRQWEDKTQIDGRGYTMTLSVAEAQVLTPSAERPRAPEKNIVGEFGDYLSENLADPVREGYGKYLRENLAEILKINEDDGDIARRLKRDGTALGSAVLGVTESVGDGIAGIGRLAEEGTSLGYDEVTRLLYEKLGFGSEEEARAARERAEAKWKALTQAYDHAKDTVQDYVEHPQKLKEDLGKVGDRINEGAERWQHAVEQGDLNGALEEARPATDIGTMFIAGGGVAKGVSSHLGRKMAQETLLRETRHEIGEWGRAKSLQPDSFANKDLAASLARENMAFDEFRTLARTHMDELTDEQVRAVKRIRDDVPPIGRNTVVTKVMPYEYLEGYLRAEKPYNTIGGFVTRKDDFGHLMENRLPDTYRHLALDYPDSPYTKALMDGKDRYLIFEGKLSEPRQSAIPYGERFGGTDTTPPPCTLNGFIACRSDEILPEFKYNEAQYPEHSSVIWVVEDGVKRKAAVFNEEQMRFVPTDEIKHK